MRIPHDSSRQHEAWIAGARQQFEKARSSGGTSSSVAGRLSAVESVLPCLDGYRIVREIRRGGQGVVYEGVQERTGRTVALKVMRGGRFAGKADHVRFEREVHILAQLNHRSIVGVLDRGEVEGDQFLVMDFIDGLPLDRYARDHCESLNSRLELFADVCDAVTAAHQRGVIHRDLKPSNILVDPSGQPHILDFGLATIDSDIQEEGMTRTGQFVGSLPWSSPEQALGRHAEIDVRSDVYSLGVILYQLITDRMPYSTVGSMESVLSNIRNATPTPPSELSKAVDADLETIVLKALSKEPERRYQSAGELARDVRSFLSGDAIEAKRDSLTYLLRKAMARHRAVIVATSLCLITLTAAAVWSTWQWRVAERQRDLAVAASLKETQARQEADRQMTKAGMVSDFLQNMLASADPENQPSRDLTVREVLDDSSRQIENGSFSDQPRVEADLRMALGRSYLSLGQFDTAERHLGRARDLFGATDGTESENYAEALGELGTLARRSEKLDEAERLQGQALRLFQRLHPGDHVLVGHSLAEMALLKELQGRLDESIELTRKAVEMLRRTIGAEHVDVASLESILAQRLHDTSEGIGLAQHSINVLRAARGNQHPSVMRAFRRLAGMQFSSGDLEGAQTSYEEALKSHRGVLGDANPETLLCVRDLAFLYWTKGIPEKSMALQEEFLPAADQTFGPASIFRISYTIDAGDRAYHLKNTAAAEKHYREAMDLCKQSSHEGNSYDCAARLGIIQLMLDRGDCEDAGQLLEQTRNFLTNNSESSTPASAGRMACLRGEVALCRGEYSQAEAELLAGVAYYNRSRMAGAGARRRAQSTFVRLYEKWDAAEPNSGKAEKAAEWRTKLIANTPPGS